MKKALSVVLITASFLYIFSSCSGHFANSYVQDKRTLTTTETLLTLSPWRAVDSGDAELVFSDELTGSAGFTPFEWSAESTALALRFFPKCSVGATHEVTLDFALLDTEGFEYDGVSYVPGLFRSTAPTDVALAEPEISEEERIGQEIADYAVGFLGWNYKYGGKAPETGFDCSGLVYYVYEQFGYHLERVAAEQAKQGIEVSHDALMPGDLLGFYTSGKYVGHIGIYVGKGYYVHAMGSAYGVVLTSLDDEYSQRDYTARRIIGCEELMAGNASVGVK